MATNIFRECDEPGSAGPWPILFPVEVRSRFLLGKDMLRMVVSGICMSRRLVSGIGRLRIGGEALSPRENFNFFRGCKSLDFQALNGFLLQFKLYN